MLSLVLLLYLRFWDYFSVENIRLGDPIIGGLDSLPFVSKSVLEYHQFPLWFPHSQGGFPFFAHPIYQVFSLAPLVSLIISQPIGMFNFSQLLTILFSGIFMYILMLNLKLKPQFAFISAIFYMFSPFVLRMAGDHTDGSQVYMWVPLIFLFLWKAVTKKDWVKNSILTGIFIGIQFLGNGFDYSFFTSLIFLSVFLVYIFGNNFLKRLVKVLLISIIVLLVALGLFSIKLMPLLEYNEFSSKKQIEVFSYERSISGHNLKMYITNISEFFQALLIPLQKDIRNTPHAHIIKLGISGLILLLFALSQWRKKLVMALSVLIVLTLLIAWPTPFWYLFWKFAPAFNKLHHLDRSMYVYCFATSALIGIGSSVIFNKLKDKLKKRNLTIFYLFILSIILIDLFFVSGYIKGGRINTESGSFFNSCLEHNYLLLNLSNDPGIFRITNIQTKSHAGNAPPMISQLNLEMLYGGAGTWIPELYTYLGIAHSFPAKFHGMLNTKYIYSNESMNKTGLKFVNKFDDFELCSKYEDKYTDYGINGPYLYYNELYLPRAYVADYSILVIGNKNSVDQTTYSLMIDDSFDPSNTVIIMVYGKINDYEPGFLNRFNAIFLTPDSIDQNSGFLLNQYINSGGILLPNVVDGQNYISLEEINGLLASFKGDYSNPKEINISYYSPNKRIMDLKGETGWMVLAEKFFMFEGWEPKTGKTKKPIYRANGMNSAVYLDGEHGKITFRYFPNSFKKGLIISSLTLFLIILYFSHRRWSNRKRER